MQRTEVKRELIDYISRQTLDGKDIGLDETTPLLEWGVINSLEIVRLLSFIQKQYDVEVPAEKMVADHFATLNSITDLVMELAEQRSYGKLQ